MTGLLGKLTGKTSKDKTEQSGGGDDSTGNSVGGETKEQTFYILPHDAKTNNPADLQTPGLNPGQGSDGPGLNAARDPAFAVHSSTPGIVIPQDSEEFEKLPVSSEEELSAQAAFLNKPKQD